MGHHSSGTWGTMYLEHLHSGSSKTPHSILGAVGAKFRAQPRPLIFFWRWRGPVISPAAPVRTQSTGRRAGAPNGRVAGRVAGRKRESARRNLPGQSWPAWQPHAASSSSPSAPSNGAARRGLSGKRQQAEQPTSPFNGARAGVNAAAHPPTSPRHAWSAFFARQREDRLAAYDGSGPPPENFNSEGRRR
jgi:hypothetical protein